VPSSLKSTITLGIEKIPPLPSASIKVIQIANDITSSPKDLMNVIKVDPVLTGKVLNLVNASYFGLPQRITSLNRALILLGFNTIKNIAISTAFLDSSFFPKKNQHANAIWQHLLAVGVASKKIASLSGQPRQILEEYFICGLLHDIGDLLLLKYAPDLLIGHLGSDLNYSDLFSKEADITGPESGIMLTRHWKLPDTFTEVIDHRNLAGPEASFIINSVHLADKIIRNLEIGFVTDQFNMDITPEELSSLGLAEDDLETLKADLPNELEKAQVFITDGP
jgi:HD-like signal output (HDOD) protein